MGFSPRYPKQPWTYDARDLVAQGDPETMVFLPQGHSLVGLHIVGLESDVMLGIREDERGHPVSCAITNEIALELPLHSNQRRHLDQGDGA